MDIQDQLLRAYKERRHRNPAYSKRAFARDMGTSIGRLSEIMAGRSSAGLTLAARFAKALHLNETETASFLRRAQASRKRQVDIEETLSEKTFAILQDSIHFDLLALTQTKDFRVDEAWIAKRLQVRASQVRDALDRLSDTGIISFKKDNEITLNFKSLSTTTDIPSLTLRNALKASIDRARKSLDEVPIDLRDVTAITVSVDTARMQEAKKLISDFRLRFAKLMERGPSNEVYELNIQFVPVSKPLPKES